MDIGQLLTIFVSGMVSVSALSLIFAPRSKVADVVKALGESMSQIIKASKDYPSGG